MFRNGSHITLWKLVREWDTIGSVNFLQTGWLWGNPRRSPEEHMELTAETMPSCPWRCAFSGRPSELETFSSLS